MEWYTSHSPYSIIFQFIPLYICHLNRLDAFQNISHDIPWQPPCLTIYQVKLGLNTNLLNQVMIPQDNDFPSVNQTWHYIIKTHWIRWRINQKPGFCMEKWKKQLRNYQYIHIYIYIISHDILVYPHFIIISTIKQWDASYGSGWMEWLKSRIRQVKAAWRTYLIPITSHEILPSGK